jgi:SsrA-binding protein
MKNAAPEKTLIQEIASNRKAGFQYEILETLETGLALKGTEIKSLRQNGANIADAYIIVEKGELLLINSHIPPYQYGTVYNHEERRKRKLLAHKKEIIRISKDLQEKHLTCIPLAIYLKNGRAKVKIALARGKKLHDKLAALKERDASKHMQRMLKRSS